MENPYLFEGKLFTNDLVALCQNGGFRWLGRFDNVINSGAIKIIPEQVEKKISGIIPGRFAIAGMPHEALGHQVVLVLEKVNDFVNKEKELIELIKPLLGEFERPKKIVLLSQIPFTGNGKIDRKTLWHLLTKGFGYHH